MSDVYEEVKVELYKEVKAELKKMGLLEALDLCDEKWPGHWPMANYMSLNYGDYRYSGFTPQWYISAEDIFICNRFVAREILELLIARNKNYD